MVLKKTKRKQEEGVKKTKENSRAGYIVFRYLIYWFMI